VPVFYKNKMLTFVYKYATLYLDFDNTKGEHYEYAVEKGVSSHLYTTEKG